MSWSSCRTWLWSEAVDTAQDVGEQISGDGDLRHLEYDVAAVADNLAANLGRSLSVVIDQCSTASGSASVRRKLPRL